MAIDPNGLAFLSGGSLLDAGRRINRSGIGMSASSRQALEGFFNGGVQLFNQLITSAESQEQFNVTVIKALRSKYDYLVSESVKSQTSGTNVDTSA